MYKMKNIVQIFINSTHAVSMAVNLWLFAVMFLHVHVITFGIYLYVYTGTHSVLPWYLELVEGTTLNVLLCEVHVQTRLRRHQWNGEKNLFTQNTGLLLYSIYVLRVETKVNAIHLSLGA